MLVLDFGCGTLDVIEDATSPRKFWNMFPPLRFSAISAVIVFPVGEEEVVVVVLPVVLDIDLRDADAVDDDDFDDDDKEEGDDEEAKSNETNASTIFNEHAITETEIVTIVNLDVGDFLRNDLINECLMSKVSYG